MFIHFYYAEQVTRKQVSDKRKIIIVIIPKSTIIYCYF